ncbi:MAG: S41 family peptidase [Nitrospinae bacterium]|nr:S41 family peptidase [Nitrospinota bacterium]
MRSWGYWRRVALSLICVLGFCFTSCGLPTTVSPPAAIAGRPDTFFEVVRVVESHYWDTDKVQPQALLKGAVDGMAPDLTRQQGHISYQGDQVVVSLSGQTKAVNLASIATTYQFRDAFTDLHSFVLQHQRPTSEPINWEYRAIEGMIKRLDKNSSFMQPHEYREFVEDQKGSFSGIGIRIGLEEGEIVILEPIEGTPAVKAGLKAGDRVVKIDGQPAKGLTLKEAVRRMRGPAGTRVSLGILRKGLTEPEEISIIRARIEPKNVESRVLDGHIGYVKVEGFIETTFQQTEKALNRLTQQKVEGLILDLRNNPGGLLSQSVKVCGLFLEEGLLMVSTKGRVRNQNSSLSTNGGGQYRHYPLIVLINSGSASGSEIIAGALQDLHRATIIGIKSYGKASVQTIFPLQDGSGLRLTTAHYFTPNGRSIDHAGIVPDIEVRNEAKEDRQLTVSEAILKEALTRASRRHPPNGRDAPPIDSGMLIELGRGMLVAPTVPP